MTTATERTKMTEQEIRIEELPEHIHAELNDAFIEIMREQGVRLVWIDELVFLHNRHRDGETLKCLIDQAASQVKDSEAGKGDL